MPSEVVLVYPKTGLDSPATVSLPLSLLLISARLVKDQRFNVRIVDQRVEKDWTKTLRGLLLSSNVLCVGLSTMTGTQIRFALKAARIVRQCSPDIPIVWGGIHPTLAPMETIADPLVDIVAVGEAEDTFPELVSALLAEEDLCNVAGIVYKTEDGKVVTTKPRLYSDLDTQPEIPYHLVNVNKYFYDIVGERALPMIFSRGCPHRCSFCYRSSFPMPKWRPVSLERVMTELRVLVNLGARTIIPLDDNFFVSRKRVLEICELVRKEELPLTFYVTCRLDYADDMNEEDMRYMRECGFVSWDFGVESGSQKTLDYMRKDITSAQALRVNRKLKRVGIMPTYSFMGGFEEETYEDLRETLNIMFELQKDYPEAYISPIKIYTPFPNTEMMMNLKRRYFTPPSSLREWAHYDYNTPHVLWHNKKQTRILEKISFFSYFIDPKRINDAFRGRPVIEKMLELYTGLARLRLTRGFYSLAPDFWLMRAYYSMKKAI